MNTLRKEKEVTAEDTQRKMRNAAKTVNADWIGQSRINDKRRQSKIEENYMERNEFKSKMRTRGQQKTPEER